MYLVDITPLHIINALKGYFEGHYDGIVVVNDWKGRYHYVCYF